MLDLRPLREIVSIMNSKSGKYRTYLQKSLAKPRDFFDKLKICQISQS